MEPLLSPRLPKNPLPQQYALWAGVTAQVVPRCCSPPALIWANRRPPTTFVGVHLVSLVPVPSWPNLLDPQHQATPDASTAQVCSQPALIWVNVWPPRTATGTLRPTLVPSPSWPNVFRPQQYASPTVVRPHVCAQPVSTTRKRSPPETATGRLLLALVPLPRLPPQQYARLSVVT